MALSVADFTRVFMTPFLKFFPDEEKAGEKIFYFFSVYVNDTGITVSKFFQGWCGINSPLIPKLLHLAINYHSNKKIPKSDEYLPKKLLEELFKITYEMYVTACQEKNFSFIPNLKGLETCLIKFYKK
jgi:hypothetical protein